MKKLLILLGSFEMLATTATSVVACNPQVETSIKYTKQKTIAPTGNTYFMFDKSLIKDYDKVDVVEVDENGWEAINTGSNMLTRVYLNNKFDESSNEMMFVASAGKSEGRTYVKFKGINRYNPARYPVLFGPSFVVDIEKLDIKSINVNAYVGQTEQVIKNEIERVLSDVSGASIKENIDYKIKWPDSIMSVGAEIKIEAVKDIKAQKGSDKIYGSFIFQMKEDTRKPINNLAYKISAKVGEKVESVESRIQNEIKKLSPKAKLNEDYWIIFNNSNQNGVMMSGSVVVQTHPNSMKVKGGFEFIVFKA
ncbi:lipoprotein [Williamsoniiplasma luminosum]|uniref:Lipoprotein n=1 Tax=Williamsoniiplasma luminosum TaxID=214888 RepID=A0A2S0NJD4_9MOLU|nr:lipoprotein [Williamsoniiplasma luminosum]AVP49112.1 MAG: hypothetical protein C5T88_00735 [Williamsoniiplasma luminosum]